MILTNAMAVTGSVLITPDWSFKWQQAENLISESQEHELARGYPNGVPWESDHIKIYQPSSMISRFPKPRKII